MRVFTSQTAEFHDAFGIAMAALEGDPFGDAVRPGLAWARIAPGERSTPHRHDELELFVILEGTATIHGDDESVPVRAGSLIEFAPFEHHVIENTGKTDLVFLDMYWRDIRAVTDSAAPDVPDAPGDRPLFVFSTPPTPNGDLHLGHLAGPYLGADVFTRFQRMTGREAYHLTGSDDYQSYVQSRAQAEGRSPAEVAAHYSAMIADTLARLDCLPDQYTVTDQCPGYGDRIRALFDKALAHDGVSWRRSAALCDQETGSYRYEPHVTGLCPDCAEETRGNICESCGAPNLCHDLESPALSSGTPEVRTENRIEIDLDTFAPQILDHLEAADAPVRIRDLARRVLARDDRHIPITHPSDWGLPVSGAEDQVIWVWPEMAFGFLLGIEDLGRRLGRDWDAQAPSDDWQIVHFFGFDNTFYHAVLYPALYAAALPEWQPDISYAVNEFYLLEGRKFSTSRRHAIWGRDILTDDTVDPLRLYLGLTRPEVERTDFTRAAFERHRAEVFDGQLMSWLHDIFADAQARYDGVLPDAGDWTPAQIAFLDRLRQARRRFEAAMTARDFSTRRAARTFVDTLTECREFSRAHALLRRTGGDRARTATALEFCAANLLCAMAGPLMPRLAATLGAALGSDAHRHWPGHVALVPAGTRLAGQAFCAPATPSVAAAE